MIFFIDKSSNIKIHLENILELDSDVLFGLEAQMYEKYIKIISKMKEDAEKYFIFLINLLSEDIPINLIL
ncbi:hypothetical protein [Clostridium sp. CF012]|uniref:hypothetical protein n=1 Tax=Clostridium sp. CF012 TaxID=2843319 RepID=UPI001C0D068E|nr:hypothetical protein [Clostridium sp. CF012]MBU3146682.1 hypothetical protein [Clostridium sp. CF012]